MEDILQDDYPEERDDALTIQEILEQINDEEVKDPICFLVEQQEKYEIDYTRIMLDYIHKMFMEDNWYGKSNEDN